MLEYKNVVITMQVSRKCMMNCILLNTKGTDYSNKTAFSTEQISGKI